MTTRLPWQRALGELGVIIAGVLIALWIEGARESRIERAIEQEYLERLEADLVADADRLASFRAGRERNTAAAELALSFIDNGWTAPPDTVALVSAFNFAGFINFLRLRDTTWEDLRSTGNLRLLADPTLRQQLGDYYAATVFLEEFEDQMKQAVWFEYRPRLDLYIDGIYLMNVAARMASGGEGAEGSASAESAAPLSSLGPAPAIDFAALRSDRQLRRELVGIVSLSEVVLRNVAPVEQANEEMLAAVRTARR